MLPSENVPLADLGSALSHQSHGQAGSKPTRPSSQSSCLFSWRMIALAEACCNIICGNSISMQKVPSGLPRQSSIWLSVREEKGIIASGSFGLVFPLWMQSFCCFEEACNFHGWNKRLIHAFVILRAHDSKRSHLLSQL